MADIQKSFNQLLYQGQIGAGFMAHSPDMQRRQAFKKAQAEEKNRQELKDFKQKGIQQGIDTAVGSKWDELGEKAWETLQDMGADIDKMEGFFEPKNLTPGEKKLREMSPTYARQQMAKDVEIGTQKTIEYLQNIIKQSQKQQDFKNIVFKEEAADPITDRIIQAINQPGTGSYNLDLIRKGASK